MKSSETEQTGKTKREVRRKLQRREGREGEEKNRQHAAEGGHPNELGVIQGQNAEQGNTVDPQNARPLGKPSH
jgi:hypothetical protein